MTQDSYRQSLTSLKTSNCDPACGIEWPRRYVLPLCPAPRPDRLSSLLPSRYGHAPGHSTLAAASLAPATAPRPKTARSTPGSAEYSSANWQISAAKPPSPIPHHCVQSAPPPAQTVHVDAPWPPTPAPVSDPTPRPPPHLATPYTAPPGPRYGCRCDQATAPKPSKHISESSVACTCTLAICH